MLRLVKPVGTSVKRRTNVSKHLILAKHFVKKCNTSGFFGQIEPKTDHFLLLLLAKNLHQSGARKKEAVCFRQIRLRRNNIRYTDNTVT